MVACRPWNPTHAIVALTEYPDGTHRRGVGESDLSGGTNTQERWDSWQISAHSFAQSIPPATAKHLSAALQIQDRHRR